MGRTDSIATANKIEIINQPSDLPSAILGVHLLEDQTKYIFGDNMTFMDKIQVGNGSTIEGTGINGILLTYNGAGKFIFGLDQHACIVNIQIDCPNAETFNFIDTVQTSIIEIVNIQILDCDSWGTFKVRTVLIDGSNAANLTTSGITIEGANTAIVSINKLFLETTTTGLKFLDLGTSVVTDLEVTDFIVVGSGAGNAIGISGLASSGNLPTNSLATVNGSDFLGNITPLENITVSDIRWDFRGNSANVADTRTVAGMNIGTPVTVAIAVAGTPVIVNDTNTSGTNIWSLKTARKFEFSASLGRMTYKGEKGIYVNINATATVEKVGGGANEICGYIALNGSVVTDSKACTSNNAPTTIPVLTGLDLVTDDYIEFAVSNEDTDVDVIVDLNNLEIY